MPGDTHAIDVPCTLHFTSGDLMNEFTRPHLQISRPEPTRIGAVPYVTNYSRPQSQHNGQVGSPLSPNFIPSPVSDITLLPSPQDTYNVDVDTTGEQVKVQQPQATALPQQGPRLFRSFGSFDQAHSSEGQDGLPHEYDLLNAWCRFRRRVHRPLAEWLGSTLFMIIGLSGSLVHLTSHESTTDRLGEYLGWGLGVMIGVYVVGGSSGAHLNPIVTIMFTVFRNFPVVTGVQYIVAQLLGSFTASAIVLGLYHDAIDQYDDSTKGTKAGIAFYTSPRPGLSLVTALLTECVGTGILCMVVLALNDPRNIPRRTGMHAVVMALVVTGLCLAFSYNTGTCLNPARDFGPRLLVWAAGVSDSNVWTVNTYWWAWGPWCSTIAGGVIGACIYDLFIFVGPESPVNFPRGYLGNHIRAVREKIAPGKTSTRTCVDVENGELVHVQSSMTTNHDHETR
ncbi:hypothetical protein PV08_01732 [Exophiala spinifera]|uniref:Aquaporin n=1 Tax=Exophiala spinifera TaxID=91928 RepID=A0A0D2A8Q1_9EURO|nr:uncharacterized protein PV08_01732 [Exophiala spinifera]KIW21152.1 hypothetical protein PV08_01732 [Exophiala spinifera]